LLKVKHAAEIDEILSRYPGDHRRSAVMPLLYMAQGEYGYLTRGAVEEVAELLGLDPTQVGSLIGFYTLFHDEPGGSIRVQICTDLPCALRGAETFAEELCANIGIRLGETTPDGKITVEGVMCLAGCDKAPVLQVQARDGIHYHENQTVESARALIDALREERADG
jgi:NADH-quinone oxidoreductase subunit E